MTSHSRSHSAAPSSTLAQQKWWYKPLIWAGFLVLLYLLREFFLIGFLTFLLCFVVRGVVGFLTRRIAPNRKSRWLECGRSRPHSGHAITNSRNTKLKKELTMKTTTIRAAALVACLAIATAVAPALAQRTTR